MNLLLSLSIQISEYCLITFFTVYFQNILCDDDCRALESTAREKQQPLEQMERMQRALDAWQSQVLRLPSLNHFL